jgi:hypothetical protein
LVQGFPQLDQIPQALLQARADLLEDADLRLVVLGQRFPQVPPGGFHLDGQVLNRPVHFGDFVQVGVLLAEHLLLGGQFLNDGFQILPERLALPLLKEFRVIGVLLVQINAEKVPVNRLDDRVGHPGGVGPFLFDFNAVARLPQRARGGQLPRQGLVEDHGGIHPELQGGAALPAAQEEVVVIPQNVRDAARDPLQGFPAKSGGSTSTSWRN